jgi:hypothetical protein
MAMDLPSLLCRHKGYTRRGIYETPNCFVFGLFLREVEVQYSECTYMGIGDGVHTGQLNTNALEFVRLRLFWPSFTCLLNHKFE